MGKNNRYQYYVEGDCEKKLIDVLKNNNILLSGKINVLNAAQEVITDLRLRTLSPDTIVILVFDLDKANAEIVKTNMDYLREHSNIKEVWTITQIENFEDEIKRSTDIKELKDLLGSKSNKDFKHDFLRTKDVLGKLEDHHFSISKMWSKKPGKPFNSFLENDGYRVKKNKVISRSNSK